MKTAVSIPDDVFEKVERFARRAKRSVCGVAALVMPDRCTASRTDRWMTCAPK